MKAQNNKEIYQAYWRFSLYLVSCVAVSVLTYYCFTKTSTIEVNKIVDKTEEYDKIYLQQIELASRIDTLYQYIILFNTNMNDALLHNSVSKRKQEILASMEDMSNRDVKLYRKLMGDINTFLSVKDSIRILKIEEDLVKSDLLKCVEDNKQTSRKLTIGGITVTK